MNISKIVGSALLADRSAAGAETLPERAVYNGLGKIEGRVIT